MDLVYFGSGAFGLPTLRSLVTTHTVRAIVTQPDRPAGRGKSLTPTPIGQWATDSAPDIPLLKPDNVNEPEITKRVRDFKADAWVVIAFGQKLSNNLLKGVFSMNLHASLLPRWRGAAPINWAILAGDDETGNSVITLAERMDAGLVLGQTRRPIGDETAGRMHDLLAADGPELVERVLDAHAAGMLMPVEQDESKVTLAPKLSSADRWVDFSQPAPTCLRRIHGLTPWPGVSITLGNVRLKVSRVEVVTPPAQSEPGMLIDAQAGIVSCADGTAIRLIDVQPPGKRVMPWADFARGHAPQTGAGVDGGQAP